MARTRRFIGLLTLLALAAIFVGVTGFELSLPRIGSGAAQRAPLPGVRQVAASVLLRAPAGGELGFLAVEPSGNFIVSDPKRHTLMRFDASGHLLSEWGPRFGDLSISEPAGVGVQGDTVYLLDRGTPRVFRLDTVGNLLSTISLESLGTYGLNGMSVDPSGSLYVADTGRNRILVFSPAGQLLKQIGRGGTDLGGLTQPMMLAFASDGTFFVADWENKRIERFDATAQATDVFSTPSNPWGVVVDQAGRVFVPDADHRRVQAYTPQGAPLGEFGAPGSPPIDVVPRQLAFARMDRPSLYVLGGDGIVRVDFENTAPPPQGGSDLDVLSVAVIGLMTAFMAFAVLSRRGRRAASVRAALDRPIGLHAENGAQREYQQPARDQQRSVAYQSEGEHEPAEQHEQAEQDSEPQHVRRS